MGVLFISKQAKRTKDAETQSNYLGLYRRADVLSRDSMMIYKYMPCDDERLNALKINQLWMSPPQRFNDPFDCDHLIGTDMSHDERLRVIAEVGSCNTDKLSARPDITKIIIQKDGADYFKKKLLQIGICCFSSGWNSVAMWSHYADSHRGICLGYDARDLIGKTGYSFAPVEYQVDPPQIHISDVAFDFETAIHRYIFKKKTEWEREKEWRLVRLLGGKGLVESPMSLHSVIIGINTSLEDEKSIQAILSDSDVSFFKLEQEAGTFDLQKSAFEGT